MNTYRSYHLETPGSVDGIVPRDTPGGPPAPGPRDILVRIHAVSLNKRDLLILDGSYPAGRTVLLVSHVTPIKTFVQLALGAPPAALFRMELSAAALSAVAYYADGNASVRLFNDTSHLR